jgi:glycosyltransferase involved in cell wall biosynthesis
VKDLDVAWPSVAVVVCAFNEESTLEQCLRGCDGIDYPDLDLLVVDDGSTDATPAIARSHPRVRLCTVPHGGLAAARNFGFREARGDLVAYLDADAEPAPNWVWYLALGALGDGLAGAGGPNVPPPAEPLPARAVALASGGPMPQLRAEDRAVHVPGCNMAFWRPVLIQLSGFDPVLRSAEDVEFEWRVLDAGRQIGYHPAALVWHHRRCGVRAYLRQQRSYGKGQALLERRIPERYRRGWRLRQLVEMLLPGHGERNEPAPTVAYVSVRWQERRLLDLAHRWGVPGTALLLLLAPLAPTRARTPLIIGTGTLLATLFTADLVTAASGVRLPQRGLTFRARVAACELLRPLAFQQGRLLQSRRLRSESRSWPARPEPIAPTP